MAFPSSRITVALTAAFAAAFVPATIQAAGAASCEGITAAFDRAVAARSIEDVKTAFDDLTLEPFCNKQVPAFRDQLIAFTLARASAADTTTADRDRAIAIAQNALKLTGSWRHTAALATYFMQHGERMQALAWYEQAMLRQNAPGVAATPDELTALRSTTAAAKLLANDDQQGLKPIDFVPSTRGPDGRLGGIYAVPRDAEVVAVPLPINFYYDETRFTTLGEKALEEFVQAAREQRVHVMRLVGHADQHGSDAYNMTLSKRRVETVRDALRQRGITARIEIAWKGKREPIDVSVLQFKPTVVDKDALDRRVEWVRTGATE